MSDVIRLDSNTKNFPFFMENHLKWSEIRFLNEAKVKIFSFVPYK